MKDSVFLVMNLKNHFERNYMEIRIGDLLKSDVPAIIHQCNCFHKMEKGIAAQLVKKYPEIYINDLKTPYGDRNKLGNFSFAKIKNSNLKYVINLYSQFNYGYGIHTNYEALEKGLNKALTFLSDNGIYRVGLPYLIGCGLAGGNETKVLEIVKKIQLLHQEINIELYKLK